MALPEAGEGGCSMGQHGPRGVSGADFQGRGELGSAQTHWGYKFSPAALGPSLADATHTNKYLIIKYPLITSQTDLWKEREAKKNGKEKEAIKDAGTAMPALLLHPSPSPEFHPFLVLIGGFFLPPCLFHTHLSLQKASRCCCAGSSCLSRK